ncbi:MAG: tetratricopeptide repeat protein, partial [Planctomycetes bacterium]|nr:tetratricopeptide repeat protein [Planctomycetota bacterium]
LKPDNIMVAGDASGELSVKVLDFGLSKLVDAKLGASMMTQTGRILGTPRYMAPEQWEGSDVDHRIDIYAMGLVLYELLTGAQPYSSTTVHEALMRSTTDPVPSLFDRKPDLAIPEELDDIVRRAMAKRREDRFASATEMREALEALDITSPSARRSTAGASRATRRTAATRRPRSESRAESPRSKLPLLVGGVAGVLLLGVGGWSLFRSSEAKQKVWPRLVLKPAEERSDAERSYLAELERARTSLRENRPDEAMAAVERARRMPCADAEAWFVRALIYRAKHDDATALLDFQEAARRDASYAEAVSEIGWVLFDRDEIEKAKAKFEAASALDSGAPGAAIGLAHIALRSGDRAAARKRLDAVDRNTEVSRVQVRLGRGLLALGDVDAAIVAFRSAKRSDSLDWRAHAGLGEALASKSEATEAEAALHEAIRLQPAAFDARVLLATLLVEAKKWPEAKAVVDQGLTQRSDSARLQALRGVLSHGMGDDDGAIQALQAAVERDGKDVAALLLLGTLLQKKGQLDAAIERYTAVQSMDVENYTAALNFGLCLIGKQKFRDAAIKLDYAIRIDDTRAYAHLARGIVAMEYLGENQVAVRAFKRYRELGGTDQRVAGWLKRLGGD